MQRKFFNMDVHLQGLQHVLSCVFASHSAKYPLLIPWLQDEGYWSRANHFKLPEPRNKFLLGDGLKKILARCCSCSCWESCLKTLLAEGTTIQVLEATVCLHRWTKEELLATYRDGRPDRHRKALGLISPSHSLL